MKRLFLYLISGLVVGSVTLAGAAYFFPHFFLNLLLKTPLEDLRKSGFVITLEDPAPRKALITLSIPEVGLENLKLTPKLKLTGLFPPTLDVRIEENPKELTLFDFEFKDIIIHINGHHLLIAPELTFTLQGTLTEDPSATFFLQGTSKELSKGKLHFVGKVKASKKENFIEGPLELVWPSNGSYPTVTGGLTSNFFEGKTPLFIDFGLENERPRLLVSHSAFSVPSLNKTWEFGLHAKAVFQEHGDILISGFLSELGTKLKLGLKGSYEKKHGAWQINYNLPLQFNEAFQPVHLFPELKEKALGWEGNTFINGKIFAKGRKLECSNEVQVRNLSGFVFETPIINLNTKVFFFTYPKIKTVKTSSLKVEKIGEALSLEDLEITYAVSPTHLSIKEGKAKVKGGTLKIKPTDVHLQTYEGEYFLTLEHMDLSAFLAALKSERLSGEGKVRGKFPLRYKKGRFLIENASLSNEGSGRIKYLDASIEDTKEKIEYLADFNDLLARGQQALAYKALSDFHYSILELKASRSATEDLSVALHLKGKNPNLAKGQPFEINLPISGDLESFLINSLLKSSHGDE